MCRSRLFPIAMGFDVPSPFRVTESSLQFSSNKVFGKCDNAFDLGLLVNILTRIRVSIFSMKRMLNRDYEHFVLLTTSKLVGTDDKVAMAARLTLNKSIGYDFKSLDSFRCFVHCLNWFVAYCKVWKLLEMMKKRTTRVARRTKGVNGILKSHCSNCSTF